MSYNNPEKRAIADGSDQTDADQQSHAESPLSRQQIDSLPITVFISQSRSTSTGSEITSDWKELREFLSEVKPNEAGLPLAEYKAASSEEQREQKDGLAVIPGIVGGDGRRIKENVLALTMIMVDIDDGFPMDEASQRLERWEHVAYTTYSHSPEQAKYRIVLPLKMPIPPDEARAVFDQVNRLLDGHADVGPGHNPAQLYYTPRCPPDATALFQFHHNERNLLDIRDFETVEGSDDISVEELPREATYRKASARVVEGHRNSKIAQITGECLARGDDFESALSTAVAANGDFMPSLDLAEVTGIVGSIHALDARRKEAAFRQAETELSRLNELYAWVEKQAGIFRFQHADFIKPAEFKLANGTRTILQMKGKRIWQMPLGDAWLKWTERRQHRDVTFAPGKPPITDDCINLWRGYGCKPVAGDMRPWMRLMDFIFGDATEARLYFERWCAYPFQYPGNKTNVAIVLWSLHQGVAKTLTFQTVGLLYGSHFRTITALDLYDKYNGSWVKDTQFVLGEEIVGSDKRNEADWLKHLITGEVIMYKEKYDRAMLLLNTMNLGFTSNHPNAFYVDPHDRRFFVWEIEGPPQPQEFYADFVDWRDNRGGLAALMHYFLSLDLGDFNPKTRPPMTKSKEDMIESTRSELERYLQEYVIVVDEVDREARSEIVSLPEIGMRYHDRTGNRTNTTAVGNALRKMGYNVAKRPTLSNKQRLTLRAVGRPDYWAKQSEEAWKVEFERLRLRPIG